MRRLKNALILTIAGVCFLPAFQQVQAQSASTRFIEAKGISIAPLAHVAFCLKTPLECTSKAGPAVMADSPANEAELEQVNVSVNDAIKPQDDPPNQEKWTLSPQSGDCNDYAVTKRSALLKRGFSSKAVRLAIAKTPTGEGHAVVVVRMSDGDMVLDNRTNDIIRWDETDLTWLKIEATSNPRRWNSI